METNMMGVLAQKWIKAEKAKKQKDKCCQETLKTEKRLMIQYRFYSEWTRKLSHL